MAKPLKIVHCPTTVGGNPQSLSRAERELGYSSYSIGMVNNHFQYQPDEYVLKPGEFWLIGVFRRWWSVCRVLAKFNVIHYNFGQTLCPERVANIEGNYPVWKVWAYNNFYARWFEMLDLKIARAMGKVITVTYQGDDARQEEYCKKNYPIHFCHNVSGYYSEYGDQLKRERIAMFDRHAHYIYALNPDLLNVLPKRAEFLPYANVDPKDWAFIPHARNAPEIPHVVHAPSHRGVKGTEYIIDAFERLRAEGIPFRYTLVEGMANDEARKIYESADLLIDQLLAGYYGGLSVELMALGKPVICYLREKDMSHLPEEMRQDMPIIRADPSTVYDVLKSWLTVRKSEIHVQGVLSRAYVEKWHDPKKVAMKMIRDCEQVRK